MAKQIEIIMGSYKTQESLQRFEDIVNQFLRSHNVIDVQFKVNSSDQQSGLKHTQIAYITYDDDLNNTWQGLFNYLAASNYNYQTVLKAILKISDVSISDDTIEQIAKHYSEANLVDDLAKLTNTEIKPENHL